jgi:hypothetical protein
MKAYPEQEYRERTKLWKRKTIEDITLHSSVWLKKGSNARFYQVIATFVSHCRYLLSKKDNIFSSSFISGFNLM